MEASLHLEPETMADRVRRVRVQSDGIESGIRAERIDNRRCVRAGRDRRRDLASLTGCQQIERNLVDVVVEWEPHAAGGAITQLDQLWLSSCCTSNENCML
jgi:hypothetical protein